MENKKNASKFFRYEWHLERHINHMKSLDPIKNCLERNRNYFEELKAIHHVSKVELFEHALTDMVKFKRIIAWTYPYKYFLEDKARIDLLEDIQG